MKDKMERLFKRIRDNFVQNKILVIIMTLLWAAAVFFVIFTYRESLGKQSYGSSSYENFVELSDQVKIKETLTVEEGTKSVAIKIATFARKNAGNIYIEVANGYDGSIYASEKANIGHLQDNAFYVVSLDRVLNSSRERKITISLSSDSLAGSAGGIYYSAADVFENGDLYINDEKMEGDLTVRFLTDSPIQDAFYRLVITYTIISFSLLVLILLLIKPKKEVMFALMAAVFGIAYCLIITPMSVPDETAHYEYSFEMSNILMGDKENYRLFDEEYQNYGAMIGHFNTSDFYARFINKIHRPLGLEDNIVPMSVDIMESYKACFIPQGLGISLARLLKLNMLKTFYAGRLFNLAFYVFCVYIAVKKTPIHKNLFGILSILPIFMQQAASYSYDCFVNGLSFVVIAFLLKWMYQEEEISKGEFIFAFIANTLLAPIKVVYSFYTLLYWLIPYERFGSKKRKRIALLILCLPGVYELFALIYPMFARLLRRQGWKVPISLYQLMSSYNTLSTDVKLTPFFTEGSEEIFGFTYVVTHPMEVLMILYRTIRYNIKIWFYGSLGRALSGNSLILPLWLVHCILAVVMLASFKKEKYQEPLKMKIWSLLFSAAGGMIMLGGMLITWTDMTQLVVEDYGGIIIQGIQGRYFCPMLPYFFTIFNNKKIAIRKDIDNHLTYAMILITFFVVVYVLSYTFIN